jgi:hypothetical protein
MHSNIEVRMASSMFPQLGQAGAPYAKTVPSKTHQLGALPDPGDLFDRLMARTKDGRPSTSGLSSMLIYHATIIIHDIFRTNDNDKNISDSSSYLDLSPLYGYTMKMQRRIRDDKYKLGLLKPDTFAEDRLLRQPPGVCIMLVMYNRYHNYAATQLRRINENGRFSIPRKYKDTMLEAVAKNFYSSDLKDKNNPQSKQEAKFIDACTTYKKQREDYLARQTGFDANQLRDEIKRIREENEDNSQPKVVPGRKTGGTDTAKEGFSPPPPTKKQRIEEAIRQATLSEQLKKDIAKINGKKTTDEAARSRRIEEATRRVDRERFPSENEKFEKSEQVLEDYISKSNPAQEVRREFEAGYQAAWDKLDDDLFNTARLITCGIYIQVAIHDYLRALMGFHKWDTNFTLEPRSDIDHHNVSRGLGNQVTVEFNLLYRFHCAISRSDEQYTKTFMKNTMNFDDPDEVTLQTFTQKMKDHAEYLKRNPTEPWEINFGIPGDAEGRYFERNPLTGLFDDQAMVDALTKAMDDDISMFGPRNVPKCLKPVEVMGIMQARKWEIGTLNDFRDFFGMKRHKTFESVSDNEEIQNALRDLYEHPDKIELYPGVFCESDKKMSLDPGPSDVDSALWAAIFSDAITLVRSDRFYTTDWNTNSLTSWGMKEVTPDNDTCKSSVFHRLVQRAFPEWYHYDSIHFFHPFYTRQKNAEYAAAQGYGSEFRMKGSKYPFDVDASLLSKPSKPVYVDDIEKVKAILENSANFVHPALKDEYDSKDKSAFKGISCLPACFGGLFKPKSVDKKTAHQGAVAKNFDHSSIEKDMGKIMEYFVLLTKEIMTRESITMNATTFQIDATRE